jgi:hypothetical protein
MPLLLLVIALVVLAILALRFGVDSRDDQALGPYRPAGRGVRVPRAAAAPGGCCWLGGGWRPAHRQRAGGRPGGLHGPPAKLRDPGGELLQVRHTDPTTDLEVTRCSIHRSLGASRHRRGPAAAGRHGALAWPPQAAQPRPRRRVPHVQPARSVDERRSAQARRRLASREDVLRAHLMVGARATQDHQTGRPHRQPMAAGTVWSPACSPPTWWSPS